MINIDKKTVLSLFQFIPLEAFRGNFVTKNEVITKEFLEPKIEKFFSFIGELQIDYEYFPYEKIFSDVEFLNKQFRCEDKSFVQYYIYEHLMSEVTKSISQKVDFKPKYCLTFDKDLTPESENGSHYGYLTLGTKHILYFIHIDFQEFLSFIKKLN